MQRKTKGILLITLPIPTLFVVMSVYAIVSFILSSTVSASEGSNGAVLIVGTIVHLFLGLIGIAAIGGVLVGIPVGIYLLATQDKVPGIKK